MINPTPITLENFPPITSSEVNRIDAICIIAQPNLTEQIETYQIDLDDFSFLVAREAVNYASVLDVFNQGNSNIKFGTYVDPDEGDKITLNFDQTLINQHFETVEASITALNTLLINTTEAITDDYHSQFIDVNDKITTLQKETKIYYSSHDFSATPLATTFTFDESVITYTRDFDLFFNDTEVPHAYHITLNFDIDGIQTDPLMPFNNRISVRCYGLPQSVPLTAIPNMITMNIIKTGSPTITRTKQSNIVFPIDTIFRASAVESEMTIYF